MKIITLIACCFISLAGAAQPNKNLTQYVDPYIGTGFHGHVFLGANVPFGGVQLGPVNITEGWDWCSGYHYSDSTIIGFAHTHLSGTGIGDLGDILVMPVANITVPKKRHYYSLFSHDEEKARAGYYSVKLKRYNVTAELTATQRTGFHRYTFNDTAAAQILFDLEQGIGWDAPEETMIRQVNDSIIEGYRFSKGWAADQRIYFTAIFSAPIKKLSVYDDSLQQNGSAITGNRAKAIAGFEAKQGQQIMLKVGISPVSTENALANINAELPGWDFEAAVESADKAWNSELAKVTIETDDESRMRTFYTALYHTMIAPSVFNDHNGDYYGTDKQVHRKAKFTNLTTFSLWDTYRAAHPLFTLIQPERVNDMVNSMLAIYQQQKSLPVWHLHANETNTMPGNSAVQVVADAYLKGFRGFDPELAFEAAKGTMMQNNRGLKFVKELGYIPADSMVESVAMGLEYSIADGAVAAMAKKMNKQSEYKHFYKRGKNYLNYFDKQTRFVRGRLSDTEWRTPFSPFQARHMKDDFAEGNSWQYTWLVPHDVEGLIAAIGGKAKFTKKLDSLFTLKVDMGKEASSDITGLIGQYAHGNEPSHHITYLYSYVQQPWKTADKIRYILDSLYSDKHDGLSGNEDVGQMSAWYVLSSLGIYQVNPFDGKFVFGSPAINKATLKLASGNILQLNVVDNSSANKYIQKITLNGAPYTKSYITYADLMKGGSLTIYMGNKSSVNWATSISTRATVK